MLEDSQQMSLFGKTDKPEAAKKTASGSGRARGKTDALARVFKLKEDTFKDVKSLDELRTRIKDCSRCKLCENRINIVFGEGPERCRLMLIGEGPGANEDRTGRPFVGAAGNLLDKILDAAGFTRQEVFIGNVVKCRPPANRLPEPDEVQACMAYMVAQIRIVQPEVIVCLGALATQTFVDPSARITRVRGQWVEKAGIKIMPTFHPAALLRDPGKKMPVWEDFQQVMVELGASQKGAPHPDSQRGI